MFHVKCYFLWFCSSRFLLFCSSHFLHFISYNFSHHSFVDISSLFLNMRSQRFFAHKCSEIAAYIEIQRRLRLITFNQNFNVLNRHFNSNDSKSKLSSLFIVFISSREIFALVSRFVNSDKTIFDFKNVFARKIVSAFNIVFARCDDHRNIWVSI